MFYLMISANTSGEYLGCVLVAWKPPPPLGLKSHVYHNRKSVVSLLKKHTWKPPGSLAFFLCVQEQLYVAS